MTPESPIHTFMFTLDICGCSRTGPVQSQSNGKNQLCIGGFDASRRQTGDRVTTPASSNLGCTAISLGTGPAGQGA